MCGRYSLALIADVISKRFHATLTNVDWKPRYNIAPAQPCLTVISEEHHNIMQPMIWGLIPHWSKEKRPGYQLINARAETAAVKPMFRDSFKHKRCLIPADGFFEWKKSATGKIPFRISLKDGDLFAFAGLWDIWRSENGEEIKTFTILTTIANSLVAKLHDRMPVILKKGDEHIWLDGDINNDNKLEDLLKPYPEEEMKIYEVSPLVNSWKNDVEDCIVKI